MPFSSGDGRCHHRPYRTDHLNHVGGSGGGGGGGGDGGGGGMLPHLPDSAIGAAGDGRDVMDGKNTRPHSVTRKGKGVAFGILTGDDSRERDNVFQYFNKEIQQRNFQTPEETNQRASRLGTSLLRHRSPNPIQSEGNKRPEIICQYFSQGWCIRGRNCRFIHSIDGVRAADEHPGGDVAATTRRFEFQANEGLNEITERTRLSDFHGRVPQFEHEESQRGHMYEAKQGFSLLKRDYHDSQRLTSCKDGANYVLLNAEGSKPILRNHLFPQYGSFSVGSGNSTISSETYQSSRTLSSYATSLEGHAGKGNQFMLNDESSGVLSDPSNSSLNTIPPRDQKFVDNDTKTKLSSSDWEPSVPFQSSYIVAPPDMSSFGSLPDRVLDNCEEPNIADGSFKSYSQGTSILNASHQQVYCDHALTGNPHLDYNAHLDSTYIHNKFPQSTLDKGISAGSSFANPQDSLPREVKPVSHAQVNDVSDQNPRNYGDGARQKEELKEHSDNAADAGHKQKELALRHFRAALIDFVRDLVRPAWHRGELSKDAHNSIVKKSVDKIISTLEARQVPETAEATHDYLSSCQPKIAKLVLGYVDKHRRMVSKISIVQS